MMSGRAVRVVVEGSAVLDGDLIVPAGACGVVVFAHGSGSSRSSPRNRMVADELQRAGIATLLVDLLTPDEAEADARSAALRFDIGLLSARVQAVVEEVSRQPDLRRLPVGLFGASTGAAAALVTAARLPDRVAAVVSRGGRPDLAGGDLAAVRAPTLLIVGGADAEVLDLNRRAAEALRGDWCLEIVDDAGHLFSEPGALERVAELAASWFTRRFSADAHHDKERHE